MMTSSINLDLFYGRVLYAVDNACLHEPLELQIQNKIRVPVGPPRAQIASLIYPMPTWEEREYKPVFFGSSFLYSFIFY